MLYICNPDKNTKCSKTNCYKNGGDCHMTGDASKCDHWPMFDGCKADSPLGVMIEMQKEFQNRVDPRYNGDLKERAAFLRDHFVFCDQELQEMLYEIPFFKHWKDYSSMTPEEIAEAFDKAKNELIDAWHFFMNLSIGLGMDAEEFYQRYLDKHKENIRRQDDGYDHTMKHI